MGTPAILSRLGLSPESVRAAMQRQGATAPKTVRTEVVYKRLKTKYLDGEEQRHRKAALQANEQMIAGWVMMGLTPRQIAAAFTVSDVAIQNRIQPFRR